MLIVTIFLIIFLIIKKPFALLLQNIMNSHNNYGSRDNVFNMIRILARQREGLNIVHINAQSLNCKMDEFRYLFTSAGVDIICISETWFSFGINDTIYNLPGFKLYRADRTIVVDGTETNAKGGGVAIYVKCGISSVIKSKSSPGCEIEHLFIEINVKRKQKILVGSVYKPHRDIPIDSLTNILENISVEYNDIIILGDFNNNLLASNPLRDPMYSLGLIPVNTSTPTHHHRISSSLIDLIFVNNVSKVLLYDQISASDFSNHDLLFMTYDLRVEMQCLYYTYRDIHNVDYNYLSFHAENVPWNHIYTLDDANDQLCFIQNKVNTLFDTCVPLKSKRNNLSQEPWFTNEIEQLIRKRNTAYARWKKFKTPELKLLFQSCRRDVVKNIKNSKCSYYKRRFSAAIDTKSKWKEIRKIGIGKESHSSHENINVNELNRKFVNINIPPPAQNIYDDLCSVPIKNQFSFRCVSQCEVLLSFAAVKSKSTGLDEINPHFLGMLMPKLLPYVTHLFNTILTKSVFPEGWKLSKIIPIPKQNNDYRPIAILPFLSKVMENIMSKQINDYIKQKNLLSDKQSGFVKMKSCITALSDVIENLRSDLDKSMVSFLILLDHSKAFDTVDHSILTKKLEKLFYFSPTACKLIQAYLSGRSQAVEINGERSEYLHLVRGVPQGSILGPLLFCLYINDLPDAISHCKVHMYADDVQIYRSCKISDTSSCLDQINTDLAKINDWAIHNGLCINPSKSKCIFLSKSNSAINDGFQIKINNNIIEFTSSCKNLGIVFDDKLSWSNHIASTVGKIYAMLRNLWAVKYSTPIEIRSLLAKTYLIPVLLYGCEIYANCTRYDFNKLKVAYNNIARYIYGRGPRDSISSFSYLIYQMSFENLLKFKTLIFLHKIITTQQPDYLFKALRFGRSVRGKKLIQTKHKSAFSQRQFFIYSTSLWNQLPNHIQIISNAIRFKNELLMYFR